MKLAYRLLKLSPTLIFALPLLYLPDLESRDRLLRFLLLTSMELLVGLLLVKTLYRNVIKLPRNTQLILVIIAGACLTTLMINIKTNPKAVYYAGIDPEYLGYASWTLFITTGLVFYENVKQILLSKITLFVVVGSLILSILFGSYYITKGLPLSGVLYQPLPMAILSNIAVILCLRHLQRNKLDYKIRPLSLALLAIGIVTVIACQSLVGTILLAVILIVWSVYGVNAKRSLSYVLILLTFMITLLPVLAPNYFSDMRDQSLWQGVSYKVNLYMAELPQMIKHNAFYGKGPGSLPDDINNQNYVPADILKSLDVSSQALANHDLFFDTAWFFGVISSVCLIILNGIGIWHYCKDKSNFNLTYFLVFMILLVNAICDVPTLELTSLYFIMLFGLFMKSGLVSKKARWAK